MKPNMFIQFVWLCITFSVLSTLVIRCMHHIQFVFTSRIEQLGSYVPKQTESLNCFMSEVQITFDTVHTLAVYIHKLWNALTTDDHILYSVSIFYIFYTTVQANEKNGLNKKSFTVYNFLANHIKIFHIIIIPNLGKVVKFTINYFNNKF